MIKKLIFLAIIIVPFVKGGIFCHPHFKPKQPKVTQVDIQTVNVSWNITCKLDCCPTNFLVKYWEAKYNKHICNRYPDGSKYEKKYHDINFY